MPWKIRYQLYTNNVVQAFGYDVMAFEPGTPNVGFGEASPESFDLAEAFRAEYRATMMARQALAIEPHPSRWDEIYD